MIRTKTYTCPICQQHFDKPQLLGAHKRFAHPGWRETRETAADRKADMAWEEKTRVNGIANPVHAYPCKDCEAGFDKEWQLRYHRKKMHPKPRPKEQEIAYPCSLCEQTFVNPSVLDNHMKYHHPDQTKKQPATPSPKPTTNLSYCPCCGTNLRLILQALSAVEGLT